ncbi:MAG: RlmE family RNA methyltransferase [Deltaproteobacteria bacterium]|nr:RlmE family RNA methyltransferase [Deltaproteobacteria bacterium]
MTYKRPADRFTKQAKAEGFAARSVYKLEEIDRRVRLFKPGMKVLDLGAAPGSWSQYAAPKVGSKGHVVAVDLVPLRAPMPPHVVSMQLDLLGDRSDLAMYGPFDVVMSDMAPHTSGVAFADAARSEELASIAVDVANEWLKPGGTLVTKVFLGDGFEPLRASMRAIFKEVRVIKPEASRRESVEIFLVGLLRKNQAKPAM